MNEVLKLDALSVSLPRGRNKNVPILEVLSLTIGAGEMLALVGESGSGKTIAALAVMRAVGAGNIRRNQVTAIPSRPALLRTASTVKDPSKKQPAAVANSQR